MEAMAAAKTASCHRAALVQGTHQFDIVGYGALKALGRRRSHSVTSGSFRVGGRDWAVACRFDHRGLADVELASGGGSVRAVASFAVEDPAGRNSPLLVGRMSALKEAIPDVSLRLLEERYVKDDRLRIRCTVRVLVEEAKPPATRYCFVAAPAPTGITARCIASLLETMEQRGGDVTFVVEAGSCCLEAHRLVLAMRSPVFRAMFFGGTADSTQERFAIDDDMRAPVFRAMLHYIYTDELPPPALLDLEDDLNAVGELLVAADLYDLERLRLMCEKALWDSIVRRHGNKAGTSAAGRAMWALCVVRGRDKCRRLEELCAAYVGGAWEAATASDEYRDLKANCPDALFDVLERLIHIKVGGVSASSSSPEKHKQVKSASTYRWADVRRGSHRLTVLGHSVVRWAHGRGEFIRSGAFEVGGHQWRLLYYPSGYYQGDPNHVAVLLQQLGTFKGGVTIQVSGTLKVGGGETASLLDFSHAYTADAPEAGTTGGVLTVAHVQSRLVGPDDTLTIECHFEFHQKVNNNIAAVTSENQELLIETIEVPPPSMTWQLSRLLETGLGSDVTFSVEDRHIRAHTLVLSARAPAVLQQAQPAEVVHSTSTRRKQRASSSTTSMLWVEGIAAVVFEAVLHFVYTDHLPPLDDLVLGRRSGHAAADDAPATATATSRTRMAGDLLAAAERYQLLERMRPLCENLLCDLIITLETAAATLELARRHARPELKAFCLDYMSSPGVLTAVAATQGFKDLPAEALRDLLDHMAAAAASASL
ncbi:unnamed protein product [Urochloa humidicola]